jgi:hypothetical protein
MGELVDPGAAAQEAAELARAKEYRASQKRGEAAKRGRLVSLFGSPAARLDLKRRWAATEPTGASHDRHTS